MSTAPTIHTIPSHPWSHLSLDIITAMAISKGYTMILVVVDLFSKACDNMVRQILDIQGTTQYLVDWEGY